MLKRFKEKLIEGILFLSSTTSSLAVFLIVIFLFKEGLSLFSKSPAAEQIVILLGDDIGVKKISPEQVRAVFQDKITNWKQLGGADLPIKHITLSELGDMLSVNQHMSADSLPLQIGQVFQQTPGIIGAFSEKYISPDMKKKIMPLDKISLPEIFKGKEWYPTSEPVSEFGILPLLLGTLMVAFGAILLALPIGLAAAIYMAEIANDRFRNILKPVIELLAGIPSVVYGFFGLIVVVPFLQKIFHLPVGDSALAGCIILGIMALPTIITISEDALRNTPRSMREASLALGATQWQTIKKVVIPNSLSGIAAATILGIGRAIGETMAVLMVTGNAAIMPHSFLQPVRTIPATIAAELGEAPYGGNHFAALFFLGCILFVITLVINLLVELVLKRKKIQ